MIQPGSTEFTLLCMTDHDTLRYPMYWEILQKQARYILVNGHDFLTCIPTPSLHKHFSWSPPDA